MKRILILARTQQGTDAIKEHIKSSKNLKGLQKVQFRAMGYKHKIIRGDHPAQIELSVNNAYIESRQELIDLLIKEIEKTLQLNGAMSEDYRIKV